MTGSIQLDQGANITNLNGNSRLSFNRAGHVDVTTLGYDSGQGVGQRLTILPSTAASSLSPSYPNGGIQLIDKNSLGGIMVRTGRPGNGLRGIFINGAFASNGTQGVIDLKNDTGDRLTFDGITGPSIWSAPQGVQINGLVNYSQNLHAQYGARSLIDKEFLDNEISDLLSGQQAFAELRANSYLKVGTNSIHVSSGPSDNHVFTTNGPLKINGVGSVTTNQGTVSATGQNTLVNPDGGMVGIGGVPTSTLTVRGDFRLDDNAQAGYILSATDNQGSTQWIPMPTPSPDNDWGFTGPNDIYHQSGSVGIGTNSPGARLDVNALSVNTLNTIVRITAPKTFASGGYGGITPQHLFQVRKSTDASGTVHNTFFAVENDGTVGVGTANPSFPLDVQMKPGTSKTVARFGDANQRQVFLVPDLASNDYNFMSQDQDIGMFWSDGLGSAGQNANAALVLGPWTNQKKGMRIDKDGRVSIGTSDTPLLSGGGLNPNGYRLFVAGGILSEKIKVAIESSAEWSDFVFEDDYDLKPLSEVESFIQEHHHLPEVPSADEVAEAGIDVAKMDAILLQKIEELTLHMIEMEKSLNALRKENEALKTEIQAVRK